MSDITAELASLRAELQQAANEPHLKAAAEAVSEAGAMTTVTGWRLISHPAGTSADAAKRQHRFAGGPQPASLRPYPGEETPWTQM